MSRKTPEHDTSVVVGDTLLDEQAIEWLARLRRPELTDEETEAFADWIAQGPEQQSAFDRMTSLWALTGGLRQESRVSGNVPSLVQQRTIPQSLPRRWERWYAIAATVIFGVLTLSFLENDQSHATKPGEQREITLEDGSRIWLNTDTTVVVDVQAGDDRELQILRGEVYFEIAPDVKHPFEIKTPTARIRVTGTAFNVYSSATDTRVDVASGTVEITSDRNGSSGTLTASEGDQVTADASGLHRTGELTRLDAWRNGRIVYNDVTLGALLADLDRYLPGTISIADDSLADIAVSAHLRLEDEGAMLDALTRSLDLTSTRVPGDLILITKK